MMVSDKKSVVVQKVNDLNYNPKIMDDKNIMNVIKTGIALEKNMHHELGLPIARYDVAKSEVFYENTHK